MKPSIQSFIGALASLGFMGGPVMLQGRPSYMPKPQMRPCPDCGKPTKGTRINGGASPKCFCCHQQEAQCSSS